MIAAAAAELFLERGYPGTTLADVAEAAGVGARTVYLRFGTKATPGPLLAVTAQAEPLEPDVAAAAQAGREETVRQVQQSWAALHADGLLHTDADPDWAGATTGLLGAADTYLLITRDAALDPAGVRGVDLPDVDAPGDHARPGAQGMTTSPRLSSACAAANS